MPGIGGKALLFSLLNPPLSDFTGATRWGIAKVLARKG
jgi:hypothetical protein